MVDSIKAVIGLGNPGSNYSLTRHNAGMWYVDNLAKDYGCTWKLDKKNQVETTELTIDGKRLRLCKPTTFMNDSGRAVNKFIQYYTLSLNEILVAHDDIDLEVGQIKLKFDGGHGGHNGLRDIINQSQGQKNFYRLRIGVGRPVHSSQVHDYVLKQPSKSHYDIILSAIDEALRVTPEIVRGELEFAMKELHTRT